jgi:hypothetical protein
VWHEVLDGVNFGKIFIVIPKFLMKLVKATEDSLDLCGLLQRQS